MTLVGNSLRRSRNGGGGAHRAARFPLHRRKWGFVRDQEIPDPPPPNRPKLLDQVRNAIRVRHYSRRTERAYTHWVRRFVLFHGKRPQKVPVVLSRGEVAAVFRNLSGTEWLMASLLYGAGLRLLECARLRVKDVDFDRGELTVRDGKGQKDRVTMLPAEVVSQLRRHLARAREQHENDLAIGAGFVELPFALARKYPQAAREWGWQWVFPATRIHVERTTRERRRHHLHAAGYDIRTIQELLGHRDVKTTMSYTHVLNRGGRGVRSPLDGLSGPGKTVG